jgi:CRISPR system Cascade subunit CasC
MDKNNLYIDFHILQTVPPSCVNRDDTGSPKTAIYGGTTRARVSSQAWKHAMREMFKDLFKQEQLGQRTKKAVSMVAEKIKKQNPDAEAEKLAGKALENAGLSLKGDKGDLDALLFISNAQAKALAELAVAKCEDKKEYKKALKEQPSVDILLFGRMIAADPSLNYDAAAQVAHSISTHAVHNEYDYFTAVDDRSPEDSSGVGHLGTVEYNSATLYRYATVNAKELKSFLHGETSSVIKNFAQAVILSMPTGKQNTFANRTLPDAVYITLRTDQPVNLSGAFEKPVKGGTEGYVEESEKRLMEYALKVYENYSGKPEISWGIGDEFKEFARIMPLPALLDDMKMKIDEYLSSAEENK